ncbi:MAG: GNAT family N-acetyltransferase [Thermoplasmata archaeon]
MQKKKEIRGKKVLLRPFERSDLAKSIEWLNDPEIMRLLGRRSPISMAEEEKRYEDYLKSGKSEIFAVMERNGSHIGNIGLYRIDKINRKASLGIVIGEKDLWGRGYGSDAILTILRYAFKDLGLHKVSLRVFRANRRAIKSYMRCGFRREGVEREEVFKNGRFHDLFVMSVLDREFNELMKEKQ